MSDIIASVHWTDVLVAVVGAVGLVTVALIGVWAAREGQRTNKELKGNGHGTMLQMVTDIHKDIGVMRHWQETHEALHKEGLVSSTSESS